MDFVLEPLSFQFFQRALLASVIAGTVCAVVGSYVVLKGLAFIGDAVAHAAFPGVVIAFIVGIPYVLGGGVAAFLTAISIGWVSRRASLRVDTAIGVVFAGTFALGIFLYSTIRGFVGDLFGFLVGNVLAIGPDDLIALIVLAAIVLAVVAALWKELLYATFDPLGAAASGLPVGGLEYLFLGLVALTIVISLQAVGIILVVAMLVTPAATAQLVTVRFGRLVMLATIIGASTAVAGLYLSYWFDVASGATIVLVQTAAFLVMLALSPRSSPFRRRPQAAVAQTHSAALPD
jgi:manganese/iron transport system permease protein